MRVDGVSVCYTTGPRLMFNIGFSELVVICIVLIVVVGPERLPSMMKTMGKTIRSLRQASRDLRASTGIDELLREDFDLYAPPPPRRPAPPEQMPVSRQEVVEALPAGGETPALPAGETPVVEPHPLAAPAAPQPPAAEAVALPTREVATPPAPEPQPAGASASIAAPARSAKPSVPPPPPPAASGSVPPPAPQPSAASREQDAPVASAEPSTRRDSTLTGIAPPPEALLPPHDPHGAGGGQGG